jgi:23S rRNA (guanosine2251-2'-O)-methyltransferase
MAPRKQKSRSEGPRRGHGAPGERRLTADRVLLYGLHPVEAALNNPRRSVKRLLATPNAARRLEAALWSRGLEPELVVPKRLDRMLGADTVHQGVLLETEPLEPLTLDAVEPQAVLVVLDQVTDPHNVGAVLRSGAAFGAKGLIMTDRHSPLLSGALAKAASGALDIVPVILVPNLARALVELGERGFFRLGLAEDAAQALQSIPLCLPLVLVLGSEGKGLRALTRSTCDTLCRIETTNALASLNISNAAAIALHWIATATRA